MASWQWVQGEQLLLALATTAVVCVTGCSSGEPVLDEPQVAEHVEATAHGLANEICVTIQRGALADVADAHIGTDRLTKNFGASSALTTGAVAAGSRQALIRYDLSSIPANAVITSATATLRVFMGGGAPVTASRIDSSSWVESAVTYGNFTPGAALTPTGVVFPSTPFIPLPANGVVINPPTSIVSGAALEALVQDWVSGAAANNGMLLDRDTTASTAFLSSEWSTPAERPQLDVCYYLGCLSSCDDGNPCTVDACDTSVGACTNSPTAGLACDDGDGCTTGDTCDATGSCNAGAPLSCDDGIACTVDTCTAGVCSSNGSQCTTDICGTVTETSNNVTGSSAGASVTIACNTPGNIFKGTNSAADGGYCLNLSGGDLNCNSYYVKAAKAGFVTETKVSPADFALITNGVATVDFQLQEEVIGTCFLDNVETDLGWTASAPVDGVKWQRKNNSNAVYNNALGICVAFAADEASTVCSAPGGNACLNGPGAISNSFDGQNAFWFGNASQGTYVGNFLGSSGNCSSDNGGQGVSVAGTLTSPAFYLPTGASSFAFRAWWEIESVDPQQYAYDRMEVELVNQNGTVTPLGTLNPAIDTNGNANAPYSSGGFNASPVWNLYNFDLTPYGGQNVRVRFRFTSGDGAYNGYRGWLVDTIGVTGVGCAP